MSCCRAAATRLPPLAARWIAALREHPDLRLAWARAGSAEYPDVVGPGAAALLGSGPALGRRLFAVADPLALAGGVPVPDGVEAVLEFAGGEQQKTLEGAGEVLGRLAGGGSAARRRDRRDRRRRRG